MRRRAFIATLALVAMPIAAIAQSQGRVWRIGILVPTPAGDRRLINAFLQGLRELGYVDGQNIHIELRFAEERNKSLAQLADELVSTKPDVVLTSGDLGIRAVRGAAGSIPIVWALDSDPVAAGFAESLARPGHNLTGLSNLSTGLVAKRLDLLRELSPRLSRIAILRASDSLINPLYWQEAQSAAEALHIVVQPVIWDGASDLEPSFAALARNRAEALTILPGPLVYSRRAQITTLAERYRLPAIYDAREFVESGGFMSYGPSLTDLYRRAAGYVDKILKGAKPGDLPIEQPTKFELVISLKAAKKLDLTIPPSLLARADEVIE